MDSSKCFILPESIKTRWVELRLPGADLTAEIFGSCLVEIGAKGLVVEDDFLRVFFQTARWKENNPLSVSESWDKIVDLDLIPELDPVLLAVEEEDWVAKWRRSLGPIRAGKNLVILPPGVEYEEKPEDLLISIEPRMAFGTGDHATTKMALELFEDIVDKKSRMLDLGCGNGVLTLAAFKLGAESVKCFDNEEESISETTENLETHGFLARAEIQNADVTELTLKEKYSLIVANILFRPIQKGLPLWTTFAGEQGYLILTGVRIEEESIILKELATSLGWQLDQEKSMDEWYAARFIKI